MNFKRPVVTWQQEFRDSSKTVQSVHVVSEMKSKTSPALAWAGFFEEVVGRRYKFSRDFPGMGRGQRSFITRSLKNMQNNESTRLLKIIHVVAPLLTCHL